MKTLFYILLPLLFLQNCSTKSIPINTMPIDTKHSQTENIDKKNNDNDDDFEEEFTNEETEATPNPLSSYNRVMTTFNDTMFIYLINPISKTYAYVLPEVLRLGIANVVHNIQYPIRVSNNLLQGKFQNVSDETERFIINSTVGIAGIFDPATTYKHIPKHEEDFGQTLGYYGIGAGYHVVLPFLGPSNMRDIVGLTIDGYASPLIYQSSLSTYRLPQNNLESLGIYGLKMINQNALHLGAYESLKKDAIDLYPFLKDIYEQKREADIKN